MDPGKGPLLIAENDPNDAFIVKYALKKIGLPCPIVEFHEIPSIVAYLKATQGPSREKPERVPFLILLDLNLAGENTFEFLAWLRQQPVLKTIPTIIYTGSTTAADINRAYDLGANSYLVKSSELEHTVKIMKILKDYWLGVVELPDFTRPGY